MLYTWCWATDATCSPGPLELCSAQHVTVLREGWALLSNHRWCTESAALPPPLTEHPSFLESLSAAPAPLQHWIRVLILAPLKSDILPAISVKWALEEKFAYPGGRGWGHTCLVQHLE